MKALVLPCGPQATTAPASPTHPRREEASTAFPTCATSRAFFERRVGEYLTGGVLANADGGAPGGSTTGGGEGGKEGGGEGGVEGGGDGGAEGGAGGDGGR